MTSDTRTSKEKLPDWLRRWYALKGELRFREAADEIERLQGVLHAREAELKYARERLAHEPPAELHEGTLEEPGKCDNGECWCRDRPAQPPPAAPLATTRLLGNIDEYLSRSPGEAIHAGSIFHQQIKGELQRLRITKGASDAAP